MLIVRPASPVDLSAVMELAAVAGPGFTSLALGREELGRRLEVSASSFGTDNVHSPGDELYLLLLEDTATGRIAGTSAVKAQVGVKVPFFSYRRTTLAQCSVSVNRRFDMEALYPVNEAVGSSEVGTLFVSPDLRGIGVGRLLAKARYLLMASARHRFSERVISELRGVVDARGHSPFWEALGRPFFRMDFQEADRLSAMDVQFISELLPTLPIYLDLLPEAARAVVGVAHPEGQAARALLEAEGFRYRGLVDVFDAGPQLSTRRDRIETVRSSHSLRVRVTQLASEATVTAFVAAEHLPDFRVGRARVFAGRHEVHIDEETARALGLASGDRARVLVAK